jgi:mannose-6-phosphate isomerase-like protein (cupin superfamily)
MKHRISNFFNVISITLFLFIFQNSIQAQVKDTSKISPQPKLVNLNLDSSAYQSVFKGSPETVTFHSGLVTLKSDEKVGHHNTENYEEIIVVFSGEGQMLFEDGKTFDLKYGVIAYCPPHTEHDVKCTGSAPLKYLYIASKTK